MNIVASRSHGAKYGLLPDEILVRGSKAIYKNITYYFCSSLPITTSNPIPKGTRHWLQGIKKILLELKWKAPQVASFHGPRRCYMGCGCRERKDI